MLENLVDNFTQKLRHLSFGRAKQQAFIEDLNSLVEDGVPATQAIAAIERTAEGAVKEVAQSILEAFATGQKIADGMFGWFPQSVVAVIRSGEESGTLPNSLSAAGQALAQSSSVVSSLLSSLIYPTIVLILACVVAVFLKHSIFNNFLAIKPLQAWPANGKAFMYFAGYVEKWWLLTIIAIVVGVIGFSRILKTFTGEIRDFLDGFPPFSLYRMVVAARFMRALGLLISNGVTFHEALSILQDQATPYLTWHIYMMQLRLSSGRDNIAEVIETGLIAKEDMARLLVIAQGKGLEHALIRLGVRASQKTVSVMDLTGKILGGVFLALDAGIAIFMILAVYGVGISLTGGGGL